MKNRLNLLFLCLAMPILMFSCSDGGGSGSSVAAIAFSSLRDSDLQIYSMAEDGSDPRNISNNASLDDSPDWSPAGAKLVFTAGVDSISPSSFPDPQTPANSGEIYVMDADGSNQRNISANSASDYDPAWSRNGAQIAFASRISKDAIWSGASAASGAINRWASNGGEDGDASPAGCPISALNFTGASVWVGCASPVGVKIYDLEGDPVSTLEAIGPVGAMAVVEDEVEDEVWIGSSVAPGLIRRYDAQTGDEIEPVVSIQTGWPITAMVSDGTNVWAAGRTGSVTRFDRQGNVLTTSPTTGIEIAAMVLTATEVWTAGTSSTGTVSRFDLDGNLLGRVNSGAPIAAMVFTGNEVWTGGSSGSGLMNRFGLTGTLIETFNAGSPVLAIARGDDQVWIAINSVGGGTINRYGFNADFLGSLQAEGPVRVLTFVPWDDLTYDIVVMNPDGTDQRSILSDPGFMGRPTWSLTGSEIAFYALREHGDSPSELDSEIWVIGADGGTPVNLTDNQSEDYEPAWSPSGNQIAFVSTRDGNAQIYVMDVDGNNQQNISNNAFDDWRPAWSPDGTQIVFYSFRDGNSQIYVMDADGSSQQNISNNAFSDRDPAWRP